MSNAFWEAKRCCSCKGPMEQIMVCERCLTNIYCSTRCKQLDWPSHAEDCRFISWQRKVAEKEFCGNCLQHESLTRRKMLKKCGACLQTRYCSKWCQQEDWPYHSVVCSNKYDHRTSSRQPSKSVDRIWTDASLDPTTPVQTGATTTAAAATTAATSRLAATTAATSRLAATTAATAASSKLAATAAAATAAVTTAARSAATARSAAAILSATTTASLKTDPAILAAAVEAALADNRHSNEDIMSVQIKLANDIIENLPRLDHVTIRK